MAIVNESGFLRLGLRTAIEVGEDMEVVGDFAPDDSAVERIRDLEPDVALMGMRSSATDTLGVCRDIREALPSTRTLILSSTRADEDMLAFMMASASGCVSATASGAELIRAIRAAVSGGLQFDRDLSERVLGKLRRLEESARPSGLEALSEREMTILTLVGAGYGNEEIGTRLNLATATVRNNITRIRAKLGLHSRPRLIAFALDNGLRLDAGDRMRE